ncbi:MULTISPECIES: hypothetical protein [Alcanivorax]|jgi:hypothetical protein|uniref:hypothetical protein n=1 Tax=Alcanivorax TaxID=59753 RepID=UPI000C47C348|nr:MULTISPECIES: hypothetical protein [Alcanivorax]MBG33190.1 hypothetical protein [Alcanivorax sp.]MDF1636438.1 hypothetical protein [Alcanivorax jadensis]|tara:strand:- start:510 stop:821 length:312 start_codon:yes stop_codon:yes gene_type:complete
MQFEIPTTLLGCRLVNVDGNKYCSVYTGQMPEGENANNFRGYEVTKLSADPVVFDQLADLKSPTERRLLAVLKMAAGGKSQPYIVGVVPENKASTGTSKPDSK